jgi:hypothetical protein
MRERWPSPTYCAGGLPFRAGLLCTQHSGRAGLCSSVTSLDLNSNNIGGRGAAERTPAHAGIARPVVLQHGMRFARAVAAVCSLWPSLDTTSTARFVPVPAQMWLWRSGMGWDGMGWDGSVWG